MAFGHRELSKTSKQLHGTSRLWMCIVFASDLERATGFEPATLSLGS
jgi:hypothetical protein